MLSIPEAARALRDGLTTAANLTEDALASAAARRDLHAFAALLPDQARAEAAAIDAALAQGRTLAPSWASPSASRTSSPSQASPRNAAPPSPCPGDRGCNRRTRLRAAGAVIIGRLQTYEFATVGPDETLPLPPATNPWSADHITGGSSSGSACCRRRRPPARRPRHRHRRLCPRPRRLLRLRRPQADKGPHPPHRHRPPVTSLDHIGPLAASVEEAALLLDALSDPGWRPRPANSASP